LDQIKFHMLSPVTEEPSDSLILKSEKEIPLNTISKRIPLKAGLLMLQDIFAILQVVITSVELDKSNTSKDI